MGRWSTLILVVAMGCRTTASDIRSLQEDRDTAGLIESFDAVDSQNDRLLVIAALAEHASDQNVVAFLVDRGLQSPESEIRLETVRALLRAPPNIALPQRLELLGDSSRAVRSAAREDLRRSIGVPELFQQLIHTVAVHPHHRVRATALDLLSDYKSKPDRREAVLEAVVQRLRNDEAPTVREAAVRAAVVWNAREVRALLRTTSLRDADAKVRNEATRALTALQAKSDRPVVAVLPLVNRTGLRDKELRRLLPQIAEYLRTELARTMTCDVVDSDRMQAALSELKKMGRHAYDGDAPNVPEFGKLKIANQLVYGSVHRAGTTFSVLLNRMDVSTGAIVPGASVNVSGTRHDLGRLKVTAVDQFVARFR